MYLALLRHCFILGGNSRILGYTEGILMKTLLSLAVAVTAAFAFAYDAPLVRVSAVQGGTSPDKIREIIDAEVGGTNSLVHTGIVNDGDVSFSAASTIKTEANDWAGIAKGDGTTLQQEFNSMSNFVSDVEERVSKTNRLAVVDGELKLQSYDGSEWEDNFAVPTTGLVMSSVTNVVNDYVATNTEVFVTNNLLTISQDGAIKWQESFGGYKMDASTALTVNCKDHAVTFVTASGETGLTIVPPGANANGESRDFVVYINTSGTNSLDLTAFTTIYSSDVANTNAVKEKLTALYFTELSADVWMLGRQELNRVKP